jgi:hypothetical protein
MTLDYFEISWPTDYLIVHIANHQIGGTGQVLCGIECSPLPDGHTWTSIRESYTIKKEQQCKDCYSIPELPLWVLAVMEL